MLVKLNISNFHHFAFKPKSSKLSPKDQKIAMAATAALCLTFGAGHLACAILNKVKPLKKSESPVNRNVTTPITPGVSKVNGFQVNPMPKKNIFIPLDLKFSKKEFDVIKKGSIPQDMDDRWHIYSKDNHLYFHRSWTGNMIFDCSFEEKNDEVFIRGIRVNQDPEQFRETSKDSLVALFRGLLN